jgi:hypothetical protein
MSNNHRKCCKCSCHATKSYKKSYTTDDLQHVRIHPSLLTELNEIFRYTRPVVKLPGGRQILFDKLNARSCIHGGTGKVIRVDHVDEQKEPHGQIKFTLCLICLASRNLVG